MKAHECDVVVRDVGVDAALATDGLERPLLILRPLMSRGAAVAAVMGVLPQMSADEASKVVRKALPSAPDLDDVIVQHVDTTVVDESVAPFRWRHLLTLVVACMGSAVAATVFALTFHHSSTAPPAEPPPLMTVFELEDSSENVCVLGDRAWVCHPPAGIAEEHVRVKFAPPRVR